MLQVDSKKVRERTYAVQKGNKDTSKVDWIGLIGHPNRPRNLIRRGDVGDQLGDANRAGCAANANLTREDRNSI